MGKFLSSRLPTSQIHLKVLNKNLKVILGSHLGHYPQADPGYKIDDQTQNAQGFDLQSISEASDPKVNLTFEDQMNQQVVAGFQMLDALEDDDEGKEEDDDAHVTEEEQIDDGATEISEESEELAGKSINRTLEDIFK